jgi:hypothetical protein
MSDEELEPSVENVGAPILPVQYWASVKGGKDQEGERCLLLAVLEDAIRCYAANLNARTRQQRLIFAEVHNWFYPRHKAEQRVPISFESVCDLLGIETEALRRRLNSIHIADLPRSCRPVRRLRVTEPRQARKQQTAKLRASTRLATTDKRGRGRRSNPDDLSGRPGARRE